MKKTGVSPFFVRYWILDNVPGRSLAPGKNPVRRAEPGRMDQEADRLPFAGENGPFSQSLSFSLNPFRKRG
ncbi:MAG: hypothetical protein C6P37_12855 [Caldibacillus debilis]|uniref:Uncharacterized protein n=1 Tax=Caldibacillus debilis TaxID=301148 RepID=A0A3E0K1R1_9BACI|nr:MAG: hypothetical protein C6P37_12855 [Caldibacillus debilis]